MERIYIKAWYLKSLHYFFFSLAVLSMTAGIIFFNFAILESITFFFLGSFYCFSSLMVAYYFYKDYRETVEPLRVIRIYLVPYIILDFWTIGSMVFLVWIFPSLFSLVYSFLFINYYIFFVILIGLILSRFRVVSKFFEMYNFFTLKRALEIAREYAKFVDIADYSVGSNPEIDEVLDEIWAHRKYPLPFVRKLEISICDKHISEINRILNRMRKEIAAEKMIIATLEKQKTYYLEKIREITQKVD